MRDRPRFATAEEAGINPEHPAVMRFAQRLQYVGKEALSQTQVRRRRREALAQFIEQVQSYPGRDWESRLAEFWEQYGDPDFAIQNADKDSKI